jgi:hypothetical protein
VTFSVGSMHRNVNKIVSGLPLGTITIRLKRSSSNPNQSLTLVDSSGMLVAKKLKLRNSIQPIFKALLVFEPSKWVVAHYEMRNVVVRLDLGGRRIDQHVALIIVFVRDED